MTQYTDKPKRKRKEKPKHRPARRLRWFLLCLILGLLGLAGYLWFRPIPYQPNLPGDIVNPADGDPFTPLCDFETDPYLLVSTVAGNFMTDISTETVIPLPRTFNLSVWREGSPYAWGTYFYEGNTGTVTVNLATGELTYFDDMTPYGTSLVSQTLRYTFRANPNQGADYDKSVIYDAKTGEVIYSGTDANVNVRWSPNDKAVILFKQGKTTLFDLETREIVTVEFPSDATNILRWLDDERVLYETRAGWLRSWHRVTGESEQYYDVRFEDYYVSDGVQHSPNFVGSPYRSRYMAGIESPDIFHLLDPQSGQHTSFTVDISSGFDFTLAQKYVMFSYDDDTRPLRFYYPASDSFAEVNPLRTQSYTVSPDGLYLYYWQDETMVHTVQSVMTGDSVVIGDAENTIYRWHDIERTSYLLHSVAVDGDASVFYLLDPSTRTNCKLGTFYTNSITIQSSEEA